MYTDPSVLALHIGLALLLSVLIASFWRDVQTSTVTYVSVKQSERPTEVLTIVSPVFVAPGHFPLTPPPLKTPLSSAPVTNIYFELDGSQCTPLPSRSTRSWDIQRLQRSATGKPALKMAARAPLQLDMSLSCQSPSPSTWSPPALCARLLKGLRSPRYVRNFLAKRPPPPPSDRVNDPAPSSGNEEQEFSADDTATPPSTRRVGWRYEAENSPRPRWNIISSSPIVAEPVQSEDSDASVPLRPVASPYEAIRDGKDPVRAAAVKMLRDVNSLLGWFSMEIHQHRTAPNEHIGWDADEFELLISGVKREVLGELKSLDLDRANDLKQFRDNLVDETGRLLETLIRLKHKSLGSPMSVDVPATSEKPPFANSIQLISRLNSTRTLLQEDPYNVQELELKNLEKEVDRYGEEIGRLSRINELNLLLKEKEFCTRCIDDLEKALRKLNDMELYIDKKLERKLEILLSTTKTRISTFQTLRGDDRSQEDTEIGHPTDTEAHRPESSPPSNISQPVENRQYGVAKTAFADCFKVPIMLRRVRLQCKAWDTHPPQAVTPEIKRKVRWICENLVWTSRFVDTLSRIGDDDDLKRLPDTLFSSTPLMLRDISRVLKSMRQEHSLLIEEGLPSARNIQTKLETLGKRRKKYQRWQDGRKVHFDAEVGGFWREV